MKQVDMVTITLSNGHSVRIPIKGYKETIKRLEANIARHKVELVTYCLSNGLLITIPKENSKETLAKMEERIKHKY